MISEDPIGLTGGNNRYAYVENSHQQWIDPDGLIELPSDPDTRNQLLAVTLGTYRAVSFLR